VPVWAGSWGVYQHTLAVLIVLCHVLSLESVCHVNSMVPCAFNALENNA
jgi:hypothetical protein